MRTFTAPIDCIKVQVKKKYLMNDEQQYGYEEGYLIAVTSAPNRPLLFTVHLESGALWSRLPIQALKCERYGNKTLSEDKDITDSDLLQPYSCLEGDIQVISHPYLKDYRVTAKVGAKTILGRYLFTIDYLGFGLSEDPEQFKTHNVIVLDNGSLAALPNNMLKFTDEHFTKQTGPVFPNYKRSTKYYQSAD